MAAHGARRLAAMAENAANVVAIELLAAAQGCDFHRAAALERAARTSARAAARARADARRTTAISRPISPPPPISCEPARSPPRPVSTLPSIEGTAHERASLADGETRRGAARRVVPAYRARAFPRNARPSLVSFAARPPRCRLADRASSMPSRPSSAPPPCTPRCRAPSSTSTAIRPAPRSIRARRRPACADRDLRRPAALSRRRGARRRHEIERRKQRLLRALSRGARATRSRGCARCIRASCSTTATPSAR